MISLKWIRVSSLVDGKRRLLLHTASAWEKDPVNIGVITTKDLEQYVQYNLNQHYQTLKG